MKTSDAKAKSV